MKINTQDEHRSALLTIEQLFDVDDPNSKEGKLLSSLIDAVEEYEEDQELILAVRERVNQPEISVDLDDL
ncbi:hypothetical protein E8L98_08370 [Vibrio cholerae]|nr:hypothetical protein [Vibrio parahaemolyticus]EGR0569092.1 hypothetical protein [Vibrio cholerae]EJL6606013.1 hypothetical protein [Vibrio cholerae]EJL6662916.1 hypothetical protein [Vibrio cholerae]MCR9656955.1 hypothetical protein [Vibrio parahaemolyticus]